MPAAANPPPLIDQDRIKAGRDVVNNIKNYLVLRGVVPYQDFVRELSQPADLTLQGTQEVSNLRKKLLTLQRLAKPKLVAVRGTLYPCALLSAGWWERQQEERPSEREWISGLQEWLFYGFHEWGPSWDFSWGLDALSKEAPRPYFIAQLGDGDEANSIPVVVPAEKARKLREIFLGTWGGLQVEVTGLLGHRSQFSRDPYSVRLLGDILDYCIWLRDDDKRHKISPLDERTGIYSGYLWKCVAPRNRVEEKRSLRLSDVFFVWEHTNFAKKDAVSYNLESLEHKESYIGSRCGELVLLQKSSSLVPGQPQWSAQEFYDLLLGKAAEDI